jgi:hypothetical protein
MVQRDAAGKVKPGSVLNPSGRPKRTDEEKFTSVLLAVVSPDRFRAALEKQTRKAENGDLESFKYICKLLGLEVEKRELRGDFNLVIGWDDAGND